MTANPDAVSFLMDAYRHLKAIGLSGVPSLADKAKAMGIVGVIDLETAKSSDDEQQRESLTMNVYVKSANELQVNARDALKNLEFATPVKGPVKRRELRH